MKKTITAINDTISEHTRLLKERYHVKNIGIFGSVARVEDTKKSDVDMLVEFSEPVGFFTFIELENFLSRILGKKVDLVTKNALKPAIKNEILRDVVYVASHLNAFVKTQ